MSFRNITHDDLKTYLGFMNLAYAILGLGIPLLAGAGLGFWPMPSQQTVTNIAAIGVSSFLVAFTPFLVRMGKD